MDSKPMFLYKLLVAACVLTLAVCLAADAMAEPLRVLIVQARGGLNVRASPGIDAKAVYLLDDCETVVILEEQDGWALVGKNIAPHAVLGWACMEYLK